MIVISHVVALSNNNVIGVNNDLPWNLKKDLAHFKEYTNNKIIIMGRKTFESIGRPLPNRINFVVSKTIKDIEGAHVFTSTEDALSNANNLCVENEHKEIVIIGIVSSFFLIFYGSIRFIIEFYRQPDSHMGYIVFDTLSMGQILCIPMIIAGCIILVYSKKA